MSSTLHNGRLWSQAMNFGVRLTYVFIGPVALTGAALASGRLRALFFAAGGVATFLGFLLAEYTLSQRAKQSILDTAVEFLHASGVRQVRANFMRLQRGEVLKMVYLSTAYRDFERINSWHRGDGSCASTALEERVPVLGGHPEQLVPEPNVDFIVRVMVMKNLEGEQIRSVLCIPVFRGDSNDVVGVITFDDILPLNESMLKSPDIVRVARDLGRTFLRSS